MTGRKEFVISGRQNAFGVKHYYCSRHAGSSNDPRISWPNKTGTSASVRKSIVKGISSNVVKPGRLKLHATYAVYEGKLLSI